jgi:hypothetical protein
MRRGRPALGPRYKTIDIEGAFLASPRKWQVGLCSSFFFFFYKTFFIFPQLSSLFYMRGAYPRANKQIMPTLECYPGAKCPYIYIWRLPWSYPRPPGLPWSYPRPPGLPWSYPRPPGLPWSYPGARYLCVHAYAREGPTLELP